MLLGKIKLVSFALGYPPEVSNVLMWIPVMLLCTVIWLCPLIFIADEIFSSHLIIMLVRTFYETQVLRCSIWDCMIAFFALIWLFQERNINAYYLFILLHLKLPAICLSCSSPQKFLALSVIYPFQVQGMILTSIDRPWEPQQFHRLNQVTLVV